MSPPSPDKSVRFQIDDDTWIEVDDDRNVRALRHLPKPFESKKGETDKEFAEAYFKEVGAGSYRMPADIIRFEPPRSGLWFHWLDHRDLKAPSGERIGRVLFAKQVCRLSFVGDIDVLGAGLRVCKCPDLIDYRADARRERCRNGYKIVNSGGGC